MIDVEEDGTQHETSFTESYLNQLLDLWYDATLESSGDCDINPTNCSNGTEIEESCDCSDYCGDTIANSTRRRLDIFAPDSMTEIRIADEGFTFFSKSTHIKNNDPFMCSAALIGPRYYYCCRLCSWWHIWRLVHHFFFFSFLFFFF